MDHLEAKLLDGCTICTIGTMKFEIAGKKTLSLPLSIAVRQRFNCIQYFKQND